MLTTLYLVMLIEARCVRCSQACYAEIPQHNQGLREVLCSTPFCTRAPVEYDCAAVENDCGDILVLID
jgi:hypothetical protein